MIQADVEAPNPLIYYGRIDSSRLRVGPVLSLGCPAAAPVESYANLTACASTDFACTPSGFRAHADGQYVAGHAPERPGWGRGLLAGSDRCGRGGLLGRYRDRIAALRKVDPERWPHSSLLGS